LGSFKYWPKQYRPTKTQLAEAGFFHTVVANKVICFCCGVAILDWEPTADSWQQHALVSSQCHFILHEKGPEFIREMAAIKHRELQTGAQQQQEMEVTLIGERNEYLNRIEQLKREVEEEIKKYEKDNVCVFCVSKDRNIMFKPCRHICCCEQCLPNFKGKPCPYCKTIIQGWQVVFLP
ncbi:hypothetical protein LOTGIDRAFT_115434, partial [Lottia gigantea]